jgi:O-antigen/teichoic acid export membrane protein
MSKKISLTQNFIYNLLYNIFNVIAPLLVAPYISRILGVDGVGISSYTLSIVSNFIIVASLGTATYAQREIAMCRENKYEYSKKTIEIGILRFIMSFVIGIIYIICFVLPIFNKEYNFIYGILLINILSNILDFSWFFQGIEDFKKISIVQIISKVIYIVGIFALVKSADDLNIYVLLNSIVLLMNSVIPFFYIFKNCQRVPLKELKFIKHLKASLVYFIPTVAVQIYTVLDKTMIGAITGSTSENGFYEQADKLVKAGLSVITSINIIMRSRASYLYAQKDIEAIKRLIAKSLDLLTFLVYPIAFGLVAVADWFVPIFFGSGYEKVITLIYILAPIVVIIGISNLIGTHYYTPIGKQSTSNKFLIVGAIVNLIVNFILIKPFASIGAAIASVLAEFVIAILYLYFAKEVIRLKHIIKKSFKNIITSFLMLLVVVGLKQVFSLSIINLCLVILVGMIFYIIASLICRDEFLIYVLNKMKEIINQKKKGEA